MWLFSDRATMSIKSRKVKLSSSGLGLQGDSEGRDELCGRDKPKAAESVVALLSSCAVATVVS